MMKLDQPVESQAEKEVMDETTQGTADSVAAASSPEVIIQENDEIPALVISDSEGDEPNVDGSDKIEASNEIQKGVRDVSGVTPMDDTVFVVDQDDEGVTNLDETNSKQPKLKEASTPTEDTTSEHKDKTSEVYENIDLTGVSSADDSVVSDQGCETMEKNGEESEEKVLKDCANLTAQELLLSLLGECEDDRDPKRTVEATPSTECSVMMDLTDETNTANRSPKQPRDRNKGEGSQQDQKEEVSDTPGDPVGRQEHDTEIEDKSPEMPVSVSRPSSSNLSMAAKVESERNCHAVSEAGTAIKDNALAIEKTGSRDSEDSASPKNADVEDDIVCLLEEIDHLIEVGTDDHEDHEDHLDDISLHSAEESCVMQSEKNRQIKHNESDSIQDPRNEVRLLEIKDPGGSGKVNASGTSHMQRDASRNSVDDLNCNVSDNGENVSKSKKTENSNKGKLDKEQSQPATRSSLSLCVEDSAVVLRSTSTMRKASENVSTGSALKLPGANNYERSTPDSDTIRQNASPMQCSDVLVIDDDDEDDHTAPTIEDGKNVTASAKRLHNFERSKSAKRSKMENTSWSTKPSSPTIEASSAKHLDTAEPIVPQRKPLAMEFLKKFSKPLSSLTRDDLEELVLQKICEALMYRSHLADERKRTDKIEKILKSLRQRLMDITKQYSDLKVVHDRAVLDLQRKASRFVTPVKITRAVGLQVNIPPQLSFQAFRTSMEPANGNSNRVAELPTSASVGTGLPADALGTTGNPGSIIELPNGAQGTNVVQRVVSKSVSVQNPPPNVIRTTIPMNVTFVHNSTANAVTIKPGPSKTYSTANKEVSPSCSSPSGSSSSSYSGSSRIYKSTAAPSNEFDGSATSNGDGTGIASVGSLTARKKTVHKFTPKRPPLSAFQQKEQEKMARQQQEMLLQEIYSQQARMAKIAASNSKGDQEESTAAVLQNVSAVAQKIPSRTIATQFRSLAPPSNASTTSEGSAVKNVRPFLRVASSITNLTAQSAVKQAGRTSAPSTQLWRPSSVSAESLIDLTDEEERPRLPSVNSGPSMTARNHQNQTETAEKQQTPTILLTQSGQSANNEMMRMYKMTRNLKYAAANSQSATHPAASNATTSHTSSAQLGSTNATRAILAKRLLGHASAVGTPVLVNGQIRQSVPPMDKPPKAQPPVKLPMYPPPLPLPGVQYSEPGWKESPPQPSIRINNVPTGIVISWSMPDLSHLHAGIEIYQIYAFQESLDNSTPESWRHVGDVKSLPLPMAVTLTHFHEGQRYHFAVRAIDEKKRVGPFSDPRTWNEVNVLPQVEN